MNLKRMALLCLVVFMYACGMQSEAAEVRKLGANDLEWADQCQGEETYTLSPGGKTVTKIDASHIPMRNTCSTVEDAIDDIVVGTLNLPGSTCSAGTFPTGIDNAGEVTGCTDLVTQAELAVWPGTTNLVTLGTITTGTWHGNEITDAYLADTHTHTDNTIEVADLVTSSGTASSSTYYRGDGAWGTPEGSGNVSQLAHDLYVKNVTENDNTLLFRADTDITITRLDCIIDPSEDAGTDNVTVTYYECNSNGDSCSLTGASVIATNITASDTSFVNASIDNTDWVSVGFSSIEGSPTNLNCTLVYTVD